MFDPCELNRKLEGSIGFAADRCLVYYQVFFEGKSMPDESCAIFKDVGVCQGCHNKLTLL